MVASINVMNSTFQLILLPGLGRPSAAGTAACGVSANWWWPPWIPPRKQRSLPEYARGNGPERSRHRATAVISGRPCRLDGMLAYEMARHLKPDAVVLIASAAREGLRPVYSLGRWLLPVQAWSVAKLLSGPVAANQASQVGCETRNVDSRCSRSRIPVSLHWDRSSDSPMGARAVGPAFPSSTSTGSRDPVIPARRVEPDVMVPNGGHLINMTHPKK